MGMTATVNENVENKLNALVKDGLKLHQMTIASASRKESRNANKPGLIIAKCRHEEYNGCKTISKELEKLLICLYSS